MSQINISQYANQLNMANSDLVWVISSSKFAEPQYQYVCALKDSCGTVLTTIKQQPNPTGYGVFNLGRLVRQYLEYDAIPELFSGGESGLFQHTREAAKFFVIAFGEQYGTSTTSSLTYYTGVGNATGSIGTAEFTGSIPYYYLINGVVDPNSGGWNWNTSSYYIPQTTPSSATFNYNVCLTDAPRIQTARKFDYLTISAMNGSIAESSTTAQDIYAIDIDVYDLAGDLYSQGSYYNIGTTNSNPLYGGPRTSTSLTWNQTRRLTTCGTPIVNYQSSGSLLINMSVGPQNLVDAGYALNDAPWSYYTVTLRPQEAPNAQNTDAAWDKITVVQATGNCAYNGVRFAFINNYGVWDWFTFTLADSNTYQLNKGIYKQNFVDYSTPSKSIPYNISRRGNNTYYTNINQDFTANSDWLTQDEADWLQQLFYSPNVYIQDGLDMVPVIINTTSVSTKTNPRTQKLFNYTINYSLANNKRAR